MTTTTTDPDTKAYALGIEITTHHGGERGRRYIDGTISLRDDLGPINRRCTLANELGHHVHNHQPIPAMHDRQEREANDYAAELLIGPDEYQEAEALCDGHSGGIARELGVTVELVHVWQVLQVRKQQEN
ncbi:ImmA/IrrE family metallo-endopeptidase [Corynebacterium glyciniphilum]|nr:ImmA/IrrE family metallo-endopeptidase [Corynebacterium glyciniphilum]